MSGKILLIDDDELIRRSIRTILEEAGHMVREAEDGVVGVALFDADRHDLVIVDIVMPRQTGIETIKEIRKLSPEVPIIAMSGGGLTGDMRFLNVAGKLGATRELKKPIRLGPLLEAVSACLEKHG